MPLAAGTRLGSYELVGSLGAGGMGEVYRARDTQPPSYDVTPDGRFVMMTVPEAEDAPITVILNWTELLRGPAATH
jgi:hypothetical protein